MLLTFESYTLQTKNLASALDLPFQVLKEHKFPDGESKLTLPPELPEKVAFCVSLNNPNEKLVELMLAAKTARQLGAKEITLVAPYMCYMRQDIAFQPGEVVSQTIVGEFLANYFDNVITVDPHLHRISHLSQAIPVTHALSLTAAESMGSFIAERFQSPVILGPDVESLQWVQQVAGPHSWQHDVCSKTRFGDREVSIVLPDLALDGQHVILVDDVASSGQTLAVAAKGCFERGAASVDVIVTHALFVEQAESLVLQTGVGNVWSTDSVTHHTNAIPLANLLANSLKSLFF